MVSLLFVKHLIEDNKNLLLIPLPEGSQIRLPRAKCPPSRYSGRKSIVLGKSKKCLL